MGTHHEAINPPLTISDFSPLLPLLLANEKMALLCQFFLFNIFLFFSHLLLFWCLKKNFNEI